MSSSSVRRSKERGGIKTTAAATTFTTATTTATKISRPEKPIYSNGIAANKENLNTKRAAGKENPRPISTGRAATAAAVSASIKPTMKSMPRIDKSCNNGGVHSNGDSRGELRPRWSRATTVQRGRSSSPSEFRRISSSTKVAKVEEKKGNIRGSGEQVIEKNEVGKWGLTNSNGSCGIYSKKSSRLVASPVKCNLNKSDEKPYLSRNAKVEIFHDKLESFSGGAEFSEKVLDLAENKNVEILNETDSKMVTNSGVGDSNVSEPIVGNRRCSSSGMSKEKDCSESSFKERINRPGFVTGDSKEKGGNESYKKNMSSTVKNQSKLHEKLAFLEGKVKRIASDIKRTKEMLDMNNSDASKELLSDIHDKISGIEKAMVNVVKNDDAKTNVVVNHENGDGLSKELDNRKDETSSEVKMSVKGLNADEVEARLFPHQKMLKERTLLKSSCASAQSQGIIVHAQEAEHKIEQKSVVPVNENPIVEKSLPFSYKEQSGDNVKVLAVNSEVCEIQEMDTIAAVQSSVSTIYSGKNADDLTLMTDERLEEFDDQENRSRMVIEDESEESSFFDLKDIGRKVTTGGWFVSEGESAILAHDDGSCSYYDIANCEEKSVYTPPTGHSVNMWRDCWIIRAPSADGCSGRYVVAASAGNALFSGFCSWDFYTKDVGAFHSDHRNLGDRVALAPISNNPASRRSLASENQQWWYKPCGPLIAGTATNQKVVRVYDIRDGQHIMKWELQKLVSGMDHSSPIQWRNRGKVVVAETESVSLWDVGSLEPQALLSVSSSNRKIDALHVHNTDAELGGGVRQRASSSETEGNDGVFCTSDFIHVLDFRQPNGIGIKIPKVGIEVQSVFSRGDSIYLGCTNLRSAGKKQYCSQIQQFSLRKQKLHNTYNLPELNAHSHFTSITQVYGNSEFVMGVNGLGLFVFDSIKDEPLQSFASDYGKTRYVREVVGPDDMYSPTFDYLSSRVLLVSRDRPAMWRYLL